MFDNIEIQAGRRALQLVQDEGLKTERIKVVVGASGGPKFIVLSGLDRWIYSHLFKDRTDPLFYLGSSIGAWKAAAIAQQDFPESLDRFEKAYFNQSYSPKPTAAEVSSVGGRIFNEYVSESSIEHIINHPYLRLNIIANRSKRSGASDNTLLLGLNMAAAMTANLLSRKLLKFYFERALFYDPRDLPPFITLKDFKTHTIPLSKENFHNAIMASGAIPFVMQGVRSIEGAPNGTYRDGGMLDYHLDLPFVDNADQLVLYPHYMNKIIPGWLDKGLTWRRPNKSNMDNVIMIAPSDSFVNNLPMGKIPDRSDFKAFLGNDKERVKYWKTVQQESFKLSDEFNEAIESGRIKEIIKPIKSR